MPIDFNPNIISYNPVKFVNNFSAQHRFISFKSQPKDTFEKQVQVKNNNVSSDFDGMTISQKSFGKLKNGEDTTLYTITNKNGASVELSTFGATIVSIKVPNKEGKLIDITQGYNNVTPYEQAPVGHAGGTIGPCANKINNGSFTINGEEYNLECNKDNGKTHCHGGSQGFDVKNWNAEIIKDGIKFTYNKKDGESGYPGNVKASVTYKFTNDNELQIHYDATTDKDTVINMTNHSYFNLDGAQYARENSVLEHEIKLPNTTKFTPINNLAIPTGEILETKGTPFDLKHDEESIEDILEEEEFFEQMKLASGIDHNFCIDGYDGKKIIKIAEVTSDKTGIKLEVSTNLPGFQFYTANHLGKKAQPEGKDGLRYEKRSALCIEPQFYPDAINTFNEKPLLKSSDNYCRDIIYKFSVKKDD